MSSSFAERVVETTRARGREAAVILLSAMAVGLWFLRGRWAEGGFPYLLWNLLLAWIPWLLGLLVVRLRSGWAAAAVLPAWLLFLPNAPYLVTDLLHLAPRPPVPAWFDGFLYGTFAAAGSALGWTSLAMVRERVSRELGPVKAEASLLGVALLTGFGVYLGRFGRWNSFDAWQRPQALLAGVGEAITLRGLAFSVLFGLFVWSGYLLVGSRPQPGHVRS